MSLALSTAERADILRRHDAAIRGSLKTKLATIGIIAALVVVIIALVVFFMIGPFNKNADDSKGTTIEKVKIDHDDQTLHAGTHRPITVLTRSRHPADAGIGSSASEGSSENCGTARVPRATVSYSRR